MTPPTTSPTSSASALPPGPSHAQTLEQALEAFLRSLQGKNRSAATIMAYRTDVTQFIGWLKENDCTVSGPGDVTKVAISEYLAALARRGVSGVSRARKLAALRAYFRYLETHELIAKNPAATIETPKREKIGRTYLSRDEYNRLLSAAGANSRDYAIFQLFLQTGLRVSELCHLSRDDVDLDNRVVRVTGGKGQKAREIDLEKKGLQALKNYLKDRPQGYDEHFFLNADGEPLSERGVRWLVAEYRRQAGITKKASPHSLRHTFATQKAEKGVSPYQLQEWLGHTSLATTQIYVHIGRANARKVMEATSL